MKDGGRNVILQTKLQYRSLFTYKTQHLQCKTQGYILNEFNITARVCWRNSDHEE